MSFPGLMVHVITTYRMQATVGIQSSFVKNLSNVNCMIQPVSGEFGKKVNDVFSRSYNLYVPTGIDIQIGDKVTDQLGKSYQITGSEERNYGSIPNLTFTMNEEVKITPDQ